MNLILPDPELVSPLFRSGGHGIAEPQFLGPIERQLSCEVGRLRRFRSTGDTEDIRHLTPARA